MFDYHTLLLLSAVNLVEWQAAPACTRRPFPSKWCRAPHTAPHLAMHTEPDLTAQHRRSDNMTKRQHVFPSKSVIAFLYLLNGSPLCFSSLFMRRRRRSTGSFWPWSLVVSHLSYTTAAHMPLWGRTEICRYPYNCSGPLQCHVETVNEKCKEL